VINLGLHSWHDYNATAAKRLDTPQLPGNGNWSTVDQAPLEWYGGVDLKGALKMATEGWQEGAKQITKLLDTLPPSSEVLPDWQLDVAGFICNVPAFIAGEPECMWHMSECKRNEHRIALIIQTHASSGVPAEQMINYAAAVAGVTRSIEASGINVAVYAIDYSAVDSAIVGSGTVVREFGEPLDLTRVAYAFHPSRFRRIVFAWREITPGAESIARNGYGHAPYDKPLTAEIVKEIAGQDIGNIALLSTITQLRMHRRMASVQELMEIMRADVEKALKAIR
jgi:hypothetical protein